MVEVSASMLAARWKLATLCCALVIAGPALAHGQTVTAMWDPSPPSDQVTGYEVCIGTASGACDIRLASVPASQTSYKFSPAGGVLHFVAVRAINVTGRGPYSTQARFSVPSFAQPQNQTLSLNSLLSPIALSVTDPDGSPLTFSHTGLPLGLSLNQATGQITGKPTAPGTYNVTVFVSDGLMTVSRSFVWTVGGATSDKAAPALSIASHSSGQTVTSPNVTISGTATDSGSGGSGIAAVRVNGQPASGGSASGNGTANWSRAITLTSATTTITVEAYDGAGNIQMRQFTLTLGGSSGTSSGGSSSVTSGPLRIAALTANRASPQAPGTPITFTALATGGRGPYSFKWWVFNGSTWTIVRDWTTSATYTWTPAQAGSGYRVGIWLRDATTTADTNAYNLSVPFPIAGAAAPASNQPPTVQSGSLRITGLASDRVSPQGIGRSITFTASATGGQGPYQYKWWLFDGATWVMVRNWSTASTYTWTPTTANANYRVGIWARDATTAADTNQHNLSVPFSITGGATPASSQPPPVPSAPLRITGLTSNRVSPQRMGASITFTASATGGQGPYQYKWWLFDGATWVMVRNWSTSSTYTWTPTAANANYRVGIWARDATTTADTNQHNLSVPFAISTDGGSSVPVSAVTSGSLAIAGLTPNRLSPQRSGTSITFTASATGGRGPYQYKWWLFDGETWRVVRDWSTATSHTWTPTSPGSGYRIGIWLRDATMTADTNRYNLSVPFQVTSGGSFGD